MKVCQILLVVANVVAADHVKVSGEQRERPEEQRERPAEQRERVVFQLSWFQLGLLGVSISCRTYKTKTVRDRKRKQNKSKQNKFKMNKLNKMV